MNPLTRAPIYFVLSLLAGAYLTAANFRGWSFMQPFASRPTPIHGAPVRHK